MALVKPIAKTKAAFDATKSEVFYFTVDGGDLVTKNKITIVDQSTNQVVYTNITADNYFAFNHIVPKNVLQNGKYYYYYFNTYNSSGTISANSNSVPFYCYTTPVLEITNMPPVGEKIRNTNYIFNITYSQSEGELLNYLICTIYDNQNQVYIESDKILSNESNVYDFAVVGMGNGEYSIGVKSYTVNNTETILTPQSFGVLADNPSVYGKLTLTNECNKGYIEVVSNITQIEGDTGDYEPQYIDHEKIYLLPRQRYVRWHNPQNFKIPANFTMGLWGQIGENYHHKDIITGHTRLYAPLYTHNNSRIAILYPQEWVEWNNIQLQKNFSVGIWGSIGEIFSNGDPAEIFRVYREDGSRITLSIVREVPYDGNTLKDSFILQAYDKENNRLCYGRTNYVDIMQPTDNYYLFLQKFNMNWTIKLVKETNEQHQFDWNTDGVVQYGQSLSISWNNSTDYPYNDGEQLYYSDIDSLFPMTNCRLKNGNFEHLHISSNASIKYNEFTQSTDHYTILNCPFNGSLEAETGFKSEVFRMWNDDGYSMIVNIVCEIPYGESNPKHCFEMSFYRGEAKIGWGRTDYCKLLNPQDDYALFIQKNGTDWVLGLTNTTQETYYFNWNQASENRFGQTMSALQWNNGTEYGLGSTEINWLSAITDDMFPMTYVRVCNGIYDGLDITSDTSVNKADYLQYVDWTYDTILNCNFNDNVEGGNIEGIMGRIGYLRLKRKAKTANKWITLKQIEVNVDPQTHFTFYDHWVPHGITQQYALVPVSPTGVEGDYIIEEITPIWRFNFITIGNTTIPTYADVKYNTVTNNRNYGLLTPIQSKYPIVIKNSLTAYLSGTISAKFLGKNYLETRQIDRLEIVKETEEFQQLMDTGRTICLKDYNGWIVLCKPTTGDTATFNASFGNGISDVSFNWVQQGQYDNQDDLYNLGIIDINI